MVAVVQRVARARVSPAAEAGGEIGSGLCVLLGVARGDTSRGRGPPRRQDRPAADLRERGGQVRPLASRYGRRGARRQPVHAARRQQTPKGTRPDFSEAAPREQAEPLYERFCKALRDVGVPVHTGVFGARMQLELVNDGPVTIVLDV